MEGWTEGWNKGWSRLVFFVSLITGIAGISPRLSVAEPLPNPPPTSASLLDSIGLISMLLSTATLPTRQDASHGVQYTLADGTKIGGLLYVDSSKGARPLVIADFGLMSSSNSSLAGDIIKKIVNTGMLDANFLVVDDLSGADFYVNNGSLSLGGYDAGRILNELADTLAEQNVSFTALDLMGESLGGLAVLEALVEDRRLGTNHFHSAITFSSVTDEAAATATLMSAFGHDLSGISGPALSDEGKLILDSSLKGFDSAVSSTGTSLPQIDTLSAGSSFYDLFAARLASLGEEGSWNPVVDRSSVESYVESSSALVANIGEVSVPVILVHAQNDPIVAYSEFESFAASQAGNPRVLTFGTPDGSHCGFLGTYGAGWVAELVNRAIAL